MIQNIVRTNGLITSWNDGEQVYQVTRVAGKITTIQSFMGKYLDDTLKFNYDGGGLFIGVEGQLDSMDLLPLFISEAAGAAAFSTEGSHLIGPGGAAYALTEVSPVVVRSATGLIFTGAGLYGGVSFRDITGTVNLTLYDALSATGVPIHTISNASLTGGNGTGYYDWSGNKLLPLATGLWGVLSGGGTFTANVLVS